MPEHLAKATWCVVGALQLWLCSSLGAAHAVLVQGPLHDLKFMTYSQLQLILLVITCRHDVRANYADKRAYLLATRSYLLRSP
jgi:hypothetical protein